ncbi:MAG: nucleotidyltransferase family protein, partial [Candidatus Kapaibacteriota bacterium]
LCKAHHIKRLYAFGSVCRDDFTPESDVDLLYRLDSGAFPIEDSADHFFDFLETIQLLLGRSVDLLSEKSLKNPYLKRSIDEDKVLIYEAHS